jgi:hypothetical protein
MTMDRTMAKASSRAEVAEATRLCLLRDLEEQVAQLKAAHERRVRIPAPALEKLVIDASKLATVSAQTDLLRSIIAESLDSK